METRTVSKNPRAHNILSYLIYPVKELDSLFFMLYIYNMRKKCSKCQKTKDLTDFYNHANARDGKTHHCKTCMIAYRNKNKELAKLKGKADRADPIKNEIIKENRRNHYRNTPPHLKLFHQAQSRAKLKSIPFNIVPEDVIVPDKCPYLKVPFIIGTKKDYQYTHSLDRVDNSRGYVKGNIEVVCKKANSMKNSASNKELITFALEIIKRNKDNDIVQTMLKDIEIENKESL